MLLSKLLKELLLLFARCLIVKLDDLYHLLLHLLVVELLRLPNLDLLLLLEFLIQTLVSFNEASPKCR